jgi:cellulose synthase/poly-beta-1,6-N-acetylglucosamine synthase-like glycosyltransferase
MDIIYVLTYSLLAVLYFWIIYNTPILAFGLLHMNKNRKKTKINEKDKQINLPSVSIVVPIKNEERVIGRLIKALLKLDYPSEKKEIILVEDSSKRRNNCCF